MRSNDSDLKLRDQANGQPGRSGKMSANPDWFFDLGLEPGHQGKFELALASYDKALVLNPGFIEALNNRGVVLEALNRLEGAARRIPQPLRPAMGSALP